jgi:hypothetical protein
MERGFSFLLPPKSAEKAGAPPFMRPQRHFY